MKSASNLFASMDRRNLTYSIWDGIFFSVMVGFGETYFAPYAISLGASNLAIGLLASLPLFLGSLSQLATSSLLRLLGNRKRLVRTGVLLQALCYLPILAVASLPVDRPRLLLGLVVLYFIVHLSVGPAWQSWMGDLVPEEERGRYFSGRSRWIQLATFSSVVAGGLLLHRFGFWPIFLIALAGRLVSHRFLGLQGEPAYLSPPEAQFTFWDFLKKMRFNNYGLFVLYSSLTFLAANIAGPYFTPYIFRDLNWTYLDFMISHAVFVASKSIFLPLWGRASDRYGSRKLLSLAGYLLPFLPLLWLATQEFRFILVIQFVAGFVWGGFEICSFNFVLDCTSPERRTRCAAYYQVLVGVGTVAGALIGWFLLKHASFFAIPYFFVFLISGLGRLALSLFFLPRIRQARGMVVEPISYRSLLLRMFFLEKQTEG